MNKAGIKCVVIAPSLVPQQAGDRIKTDRRDAKRLAHFLRSGDLTEVWVPDEQTEALRDLERSRDDAKNAERVARHQLDKFLLRNERVFPEGRSWTLRHTAWLRQQKFADPCQQCVMDDYLKAVDAYARETLRSMLVLHLKPENRAPGFLKKWVKDLDFIVSGFEANRTFEDSFLAENGIFRS